MQSPSVLILFTAALISSCGIGGKTRSVQQNEVGATLVAESRGTQWQCKPSPDAAWECVDANSASVSRTTAAGAEPTLASAAALPAKSTRSLAHDQDKSSSAVSASAMPEIALAEPDNAAGTVDIEIAPTQTASAAEIDDARADTGDAGAFSDADAANRQSEDSAAAGAVEPQVGVFIQAPPQWPEFVSKDGVDSSINAASTKGPGRANSDSTKPGPTTNAPAGSATGDDASSEQFPRAPAAAADSQSMQRQPPEFQQQPQPEQSHAEQSGQAEQVRADNSITAVLDYPASSYVVQLVAARQRRTVERLAARYRTAGHELFQIPDPQSRLQLLLMGVFLDREQAEQAIDTLNPPLEATPWIRRLGPLQDVLRQFDGS